MNEPNPEITEAKLSALLREARPAPSLPTRFPENVWRRIEEGDLPGQARRLGWLDGLAALVLRPRLALAAVATVMLAGILLGVHDGSRIARQDAQSRYLASVAPSALR